MSFFDIFILALALAVDASVVSFSYGLILRKNRFLNALSLAFATGLGQFIMPIIGWLATQSVSSYVMHFDHWISFLVFVLLGLNIINDTIHDQDETVTEKKLSFQYLCLIGLATSIDACAAGVTLYFIKISISWTAAIIGLTTVICSLASFYLSRSFPKISTHKVEILSGIILILLGFKILFEHLSV